MLAGPLLKKSKKDRILYALDADELTMLAARHELAPEELKHETEYVHEMSGYGLSVLASTDPIDGVILDKQYEKQPLLIEWLRQYHESLGLKPTKNIFFAELQQFYGKAAAIAAEDGYEKISATSFSHALAEHFEISRQLEVSRTLNRKSELVRLSRKYGFSIPHSIEFDGNDREAFNSAADGFSSDQYPIFFKTDGLGGGANVRKIWSPAELQDLPRPPGKGIFQASVPAGSIEVSSTFTVRRSGVELLNFRAKLIDAGGTYGSIYHPDLKLTARQSDNLYRAAHAVSGEGYTADDPLLLGFDSFVVDKDLLVTELNARWLGSTRYDLLLKKLDILGTRVIIPMTDRMVESDLSVFQDLCEASRSLKPFSIIPVAVSAYTEEDGTRTCSYIVTGSLEKYAKEAREALSGRSLPLLPRSVEIYEDVCVAMGLKTYF